MGADGVLGTGGALGTGGVNLTLAGGGGGGAEIGRVEELGGLGEAVFGGAEADDADPSDDDGVSNRSSKGIGEGVGPALSAAVRAVLN